MGDGSAGVTRFLGPFWSRGEDTDLFGEGGGHGSLNRSFVNEAMTWQPEAGARHALLSHSLLQNIMTVYFKIVGSCEFSSVCPIPSPGLP